MFLNWRFQPCAFWKKIHGMCKHRPVVVFHIFLQNVYSFFEQCKTFFINFCILASPCYPFSYFVHFPFPFCSPCFDFQQIFKGFSNVGSLGYSKGFFVISHILFSMLEIKVYQIVVSKGVQCDHSCKFSFCQCKIDVQQLKWILIIEKMELISSGGDEEKNVIFFFKWQE